MRLPPRKIRGNVRTPALSVRKDTLSMIFIVVKFPIRPDKLDEWETRAGGAHSRRPLRGRLPVLRLLPERGRPERVRPASRLSATTTRPYTT